MKKASTLFLVCASLLLGQLSFAQTTVNFTVVDPNCAGLEDMQEISSLQVYPNPTQGEVNLAINLNNDVKELVVSVFDVAGKEVFIKRYENPAHALTDRYDLSGLQAGNYQMRFSLGKRSFTKSLVIN